MTTAYSNRQEAAELFLEFLMARALDGSIHEMSKILQQGSGMRRPPARWVSLHQWFQSLSEQDREMVLQAVQETAYSSAFGTLVFLDGAAGGHYRDGKVLDFALYLQVYSEAEYKTERQPRPEVSILINPQFEAVEDLHDMLQSVMAERSGE